MPEYIDCYSLLGTRSKLKCETFLDVFAPQRSVSQTDFQLDDISFENENDLMTYLESNPGSAYSLYWENRDANATDRHLMLFYTNDGDVIAGISVIGSYDFTSTIKHAFIRLIQFTKSNVNSITVEEPPPSSASEFISFSEDRAAPEWFYK